MEFGTTLKKCRLERELNQVQLGKRSSLQASSIGHFEANRRKPSFDNLIKLADALHLSTDKLLDRSLYDPFEGLSADQCSLVFASKRFY